jgi:hypothetical protein
LVNFVFLKYNRGVLQTEVSKDSRGFIVHGIKEIVSKIKMEKQVRHQPSKLKHLPTFTLYQANKKAMIDAHRNKLPD